MNKKRFFGIAFIILSFLIVLFNVSLTGAVIGTSFSNISSLVAVIFFIVGILLIKGSKLENLAKKIMDSGAVITDPKKLKKIAIKMGYEGRNVKEGYQILDENKKPLTVIPNHNVSTGVYRSIIKSLATGNSSFRRYSHI